jgi:NADH-quinone oxidoreductase subunit M
MNIGIILTVLLVGALLTYFSGNKLASKLALLTSLAAFGLTIMALNAYLAGRARNAASGGRARRRKSRRSGRAG